ncbi:MAG: hypothetical protein K2K84_09485 [Muribaculaceae bacterium]|nr:hypothetical protein [Muribaculaceae bacterium]
MKSTLLTTLENRLYNNSSQNIAATDITGLPRTYTRLGQRIARIQNLFPIDEPGVIGILLDHDVNLVEAMIAVVMSGATVVTADPATDRNEVKTTFLKRGVEFVITTPRYSGILSGFLQVHLSETAIGRAKEIPMTEQAGENAAAINIDGRKITHSELVCCAQKFVRSACISEKDTVLQTALPGTLGFIREIFGVFMNGGTLVVLPAAARGDARKLLEFAEAEGVTVIPTPRWLMDDISVRRLSIPSSVRLYIDSSESAATKVFDDSQQSVAL